MQPIQASALGVVAIMLAGCQSMESRPVEPYAMVTLAEEKYFVAPGCQGEQCDDVRVSSLEFPKSEALTRELRARLVALAGLDGGDEGAGARRVTWERFANDFFAQARESGMSSPQAGASSAVLEADVVSRHDDLLVLELNSYTYFSGQAHGLPATRYLVIDEREARIVEPGEMITPGREGDFQAALREAHQRWSRESDREADFAANWPFTPSDNIAPMEEGWQVKYDVYDIAPYAEGQPVLTIPRQALSGIAKPRFVAR
ncbi:MULTISPECIES: RsiV family protein [unclassified Halomonas]|uniref:RsiV family protein n=1 Tax=unclassified Halomonas TaxID=2609666 RepID=UPI0020A022E3|nr:MULTISPECIES: RsiV family protein [unclassified Halomonas]MCP1315953.1 RsiV family protein [Halomonas sp. 707D7]MCP1326353.1 RsiV family protein [Halomonas sp. 707D4]